MDEHKGHDTVSAAAERTEKQKQLEESLFKVQEKVQEREKELKALRLAVETLKSSAQIAVKASDKIFCEMIRSMQTRRKEVKDLIRAQEKTAVSQAEGVLKQLEQEIEELRRRGVELEHADDHIHFIQGFQSFSSPSVSPDLPSIAVHPLYDFRNVSDAVSELRDELKNILKDTWPKISAEAFGSSAFGTVFPEAAPSPAILLGYWHTFKNLEGSWDCDVCCVQNQAAALQCVACQSTRPGATVEPKAFGASAFGTSSESSAGGFKFGTSSNSTCGFGGFKFGGTPSGSTSSSSTYGFKFGTSFGNSLSEASKDTCGSSGFKFGGSSKGFKFGASAPKPSFFFRKPDPPKEQQPPEA